MKKQLEDLYIRFTAPQMQKIMLCLVVILSFVLIYILNRFYPLFAEDWDYRFIWEWEGTNPNKIHSLGDIIQSQYNHYMHWGGRSIVHAIDQFLLMLPTALSDLINSLAFVLFAYLIYKIANIKNTANVFVFIFTATSIYLFQPAFPTTVLWLTGSCNYLWGTLIIIIFLYPYIVYYQTQTSLKGGLVAMGMFLLGLLAGWTNENMGIALIMFIFVITLLIYRNDRDKESARFWMFTGLIGAIIGYLIMILAPGNFFRLKYIQNVDNSANTISFFIDSLSIRITALYNHFLHYLLLPSAIYLVLLFICIKTGAKQSGKKRVRLSMLFFGAAYVAHLAMIATPIYPQRALFGVISFIIIANAILYASIEIKTNVVRLINMIVIGGLLAFSAIGYYRDYHYLKLVCDFWKQREIFVEQQKEKGVEDIIFEDRFDIFKKDYEIYDLVNYTDSFNWLNHAYARYYGVKSVRIQTDEEKQKR